MGMDSGRGGGTCFSGSRPGIAVEGMGRDNEGAGAAGGAGAGVASGMIGRSDGVEDCAGVAVGARDRALATGLKTVLPFSRAWRQG